MDCDARDERLTVLHPNPVGLLYEICSRCQNEKPKFSCISSNNHHGRTEYVIKLEVFSHIENGIGRKKNEAKADAAFKLLIRTGHLQEPAVASPSGKCTDEEMELSDIHTQESKLEATSIPFVNSAATKKNKSRSHSLPEFTPSNPVLGVNWILKSIGLGLVETQFHRLVPEDGAAPSRWLVHCIAGDRYRTSAEAQAKKPALRIAAEMLYKTLASDATVLERLDELNNGMKGKNDFKKQKVEHPGWSTFRHPVLLQNDCPPLSVVGTLTAETEIGHAKATDDLEEGELPVDFQDRMMILAKEFDYDYRLVPWLQPRVKPGRRRISKATVKSIGDHETAMMANISFRKMTRPALCVAGHGATMAEATAATYRNVIQYFELMRKAANLDRNMPYPRSGTGLQYVKSG